jgi:hypothetical protein
MKTTQILLFGSLLGLSFASCRRHVDEGPVTTELRTVSDTIKTVELRGALDVIITQDTSYQIKVEAGENVISKIETEFSNQNLKVYESDPWNFGNRIARVWISTDYLDEIKLKGSGDITVYNWINPSAYIDLDGSGDIRIDNGVFNFVSIGLEGSGDIKMEGSAQTLNLFLDGSGDISNKEFYCVDANVTLEGSGDIRVRASNNLNIDLNGSGDIYYWGNPLNVNVNNSGSGNITEM